MLMCFYVKQQQRKNLTGTCIKALILFFKIYFYFASLLQNNDRYFTLLADILGEV